ncbi:MAG: 2-C-methyl-D-erythritol 2,4-cyclodiphosphate synthase [Oscillospiraceae bacterium]|jgi:2-C-methyl-D-erythritol 4-phosphate cytidylyltransferase/2-C-methyl-D-erythritol 2,4-cyclodiphosphate synthase|nr:2-C-methyl-D-erythritol 2,4-cyclodiphosphate synthase [Oscillospiraceae bacterium]
MTKTFAIIAAAGSGTRFGGDKMTTPLCGTPVVVRTITAFQQSPLISGIIVAASENNRAAIETLCKIYSLDKVACVIQGGETRAETVQLALSHIPSETKLVAVQDGARPLVTAELIARVIAAAKEIGAALPVVPVRDTIKEISSNGIQTPNRDCLFAAQTPQVFDLAKYREIITNDAVSDDSTLFEQARLPVTTIDGDPRNIKITTADDLLTATAFLTGKTDSKLRIGHGYDAHRLVEGRRLVLCGVDVPFERGLLGHSDADAAFHAVTDALLGAAGLPDIGNIFPDHDPKWKDANSGDLLAFAAKMSRERGFTVMSADVTIIAERPKLSPFIPQMRGNLAAALGVSADCVNVKATTEEGLGFAERGISAHSVVLLTTQ